MESKELENLINYKPQTFYMKASSWAMGTLSALLILGYFLVVAGVIL